MSARGERGGGQGVVPELPGAYRWYYADVSAGEVTAVFIFLLGSVFSPRYSARRARAAPLAHCAVNFALYRGGERTAWVFSEYPSAQVSQDAGALCLQIGRSTFRSRGGKVEVSLDERTAPWGKPLKADLTLWATADSAEPQRLCEAEPHHWQALAPRARGVLTLPDGTTLRNAVGYHDTNWGAGPLGGALPGWSWSRAHGPRGTAIHYRLPGEELRVLADRAGTRVTRRPVAPEPSARTGWGLRVPARFTSTYALVESSPFYARAVGANGVAEVADFRRFHSPLIRWMAHFRMRREAAS